MSDFDPCDDDVLCCGCGAWIDPSMFAEPSQDADGRCLACGELRTATRAELRYDEASEHRDAELEEDRWYGR